MASIQRSCKWMVTSLTFIALVATGSVQSCSSLSKELHVCLNIYLERDFPNIETIVNGLSRTRYGGKRVIFEGPEILDICNDISSLVDCFVPVILECDTVWKLDRYKKMMKVLRDTHDYLCASEGEQIKELLVNSGCLIIARDHLVSCGGFDWYMSWRKVLRLQITPPESCLALKSYKTCMKKRLSDLPCGKDAASEFGKLIDMWLKSWCAWKSTRDEERRYFYSSLDFT